MKKGWEYVKLSEAVRSKGSNLSLKKLNKNKGDYDVFGAKGHVGKLDKYGVDVEYLSIIKDGAGVGRIKKQPAKSSILATMQYLIPKSGFDIDFIKYFLESIDFKKYVTGSTIPHIYFKDYNVEKIPYLCTEEQKAIVAKLDQAFAAIDGSIANVEKNIANAEELFQSKLNVIFSQTGEGWEVMRLGEVCENLDKKRKPITKNKRTSGEIPYYGASGIVDYVKGHLFDEDLLLVSEDGANLVARKYPIAFSIKGKSWVNNHAHVLRFKNFNSQKFIEFYLNSISLSPYISGMAQPKMNQRKLNSIPVPNPDLSTQKSIVLQIEKLTNSLNSVKQKYQQKLSSLEELKQSILEKAFKGELV